MYGVNYQTMYQMLKKHGGKAKSQHIIKTRLTEEVLKQVFEEPRTLEEAAQILQTTSSQLGAALKRHRMFRGNGKTVKNRISGSRVIQIIGFMLKNPDAQNIDIGKKFSCTREYVRQVREAATNEGII